jgi:release factor glutamine methyltransferase
MGVLAGAGIPTARQDAEWLLAHAGGVDRRALYVDPDRIPAEAEVRRYRDLLARRARQEPLQYLLGFEDFHGLRLRVTPDVLIPRPETEALVDWAIALLPVGVPRLVADVGTGSGAVACALAVAAPAVTVVAIDSSLAALEVARDNALALGARVRVVAGDLLGPLPARPPVLDMIVANPPYLPTAIIPSLPREVAEFEPRVALDGGSDGTRTLRRLIIGARAVLKPGGWLVLEIGEDQGGALASLMAAEGFTGIAARRDFRDAERYVAGRLPAPGLPALPAAGARGC